MRHLRIYIDTSIIGGYFDVVFMRYTRLLFKRIEAKIIIPVVSELVEDEAEDGNSPIKIRNFFKEVKKSAAYLESSREAEKLRDRYMDAGIVTEKSQSDAYHVALATVGGCDGLASWNYKHIVSQVKNVPYSLVNIMHGYPQLFIATPEELVIYEKTYN